MFAIRVAHLALVTLTLVSSAVRREGGGVEGLVVPLPPGMRAESIFAYGGENRFVMTNFYDGSVSLFDADSHTLREIVPPSGRMALGVAALDGYIFVAGGISTPALRVYDAASGRLVKACNTPNHDQHSFAVVNDVIADAGFAYFTDSTQPALYRLAYGVDSPAACEVDTIPLPHNSFAFTGNTARANGIVFYGGGLIVSNSATRTIYFIDLHQDAVRNPTVGVYPIIPEGSLPAADGMFIRNNHDGTHSLYVSQPRDNSISHWLLTQTTCHHAHPTKLLPVVNAKLVAECRSEQFVTPTAVAISKDYFVVPNFNLDAPSQWEPGLNFSLVLFRRST